MSEKLIPFDLEVALKHPERVRNRNGIKAKWLTACDAAGENNRVIIVWEDSEEIHGYSEKGYYMFSDAAPSIFITAPEPKWVPWDNVDEVEDGVWFRHKESMRIYRCECVSPTENTIGMPGGVRISMSALFNHYEWHFDRRHKGEWNVCGKESQ